MQIPLEAHPTQIKQFEKFKNQFFISSTQMSMEPHEGILYTFDTKTQKTEEIISYDYGINDFDLIQLEEKVLAYLATDENTVVVVELKDDFQEIDILNPQNNSQMVSGDLDGKITLWNNAKYQQEFTEHSYQINDIEWDLIDKNVLYSVSNDKSLKVWDIRQQKSINNYALQNCFLNKIKQSGPNQLLVGCDNGDFVEVDLKTTKNQIIKNDSNASIIDLKIYKDQIVTSTDDYKVHIYDLKTYECLYSQLFNDFITSVSFNIHSEEPQLLLGKVTVHYVGRLIDGTVFDSSRDRNEPFTFVLGINSVIQGWEIEIQKMSLGEISKITIPANLAYGDKGMKNVIPPNSSLVFEIELINC